MRILAMDTSFDPCGMALVDDGGIVASVVFRHERDLSRTWALRLQWLMGEVGWTVKDLEGLAVCNGPGSFTGLRIGVAAMKTMAQALNRPIIGISSLELVALPYLGAWPGIIVSILHCRTGEVYRASYSENGDLLQEPGAITLEELTEELDKLPGPVLLSGNAGPKDTLILPEGVQKAGKWLSLPHVELLGLEGHRRLSQGQGISPLDLSIIYIKRSQAEELAAQKGTLKFDPLAKTA